MKAKKVIPFIVSLLFVSSCSMNEQNKDIAFLNNKCPLLNVGDIHDLPPMSGVLLDRNPGFTNYINYFDKSNTKMNFQCYGTSVDDFYCIGSVYIYDINGKEVVNIPSFKCSGTIDLYYGTIKSDEETMKVIGTIYVHTPYWCRIQLNYYVEDVGKEVLLTFEFYKAELNPLPEFMGGVPN